MKYKWLKVALAVLTVLLFATGCDDCPEGYSKSHTITCESDQVSYSSGGGCPVFVQVGCYCVETPCVWTGE
jgi:hypothetical protein